MAAADDPPGLPAALARRFEAVVFDWDGTAVPDRRADAGEVRRLVEALSRAGLHLGLVSGTHVGNVDPQLRARRLGRGRLWLCLNRGSEVFEVTRQGPQLRERRVASAPEEAALQAAAEATVAALAARGLEARIVSQRLNRRKLDLIPLPEWADPPKAAIDELLTAVETRLRAHRLTLAGAVELALEEARRAGLPEPRVTTDAKHVEIGLTDKADSARWLEATLWELGVSPSQVLVLGDEIGPLGGVPGSDSRLLRPDAAAASVGIEPEGVPAGVVRVRGGPAAFRRILADQLRRRLEGELPAESRSPGWVLALAGFDPVLERTHESLLTIADGVVGTRGAPPAAHPASEPSTHVAGLYTGSGPATRLLECPAWDRSRLELGDGRSLRRQLDLHAGLLTQQLEAGGQAVSTVAFCSLAEPGLAVLRARGPVAAPLAGPARRRRRVRAGGEALDFVLDEEVRQPNRERVVDRHARYRRVRLPAPGPSRRPALRAIDFDGLLAGHREAWAERWRSAGVAIEGDPDLELAARFAVYHLVSSVGDRGEAAVGGRGLSGEAYRGHVFWDSDVFVLPFAAATHPAAARAMLEYRLRRLAEARARAREVGRRGARFPWESARSGDDVTPLTARGRRGGRVAIRTGLLEEHITADVAWAADQYLLWSGDEEFGRGPGARLLVETGRYWASRVRCDRDGRGHIYGVIGPDEYHESVDDNAFTNVMARWNLRRAAECAREGLGGARPSEAAAWTAIADALVDGYDPRTGVYEQFAGFNALEPLIVRDALPWRPVAADVLLGRERVAGAQVIKQPDVLMLHHLVPRAVAPGSLEPNLDFYEPRTAHGSSLSPGIHAALFAQAGRLEAALEWLRVTAEIDLGDLTGTTAGGVHLAAMGSFWQALAFGCLGLRAGPRGLHLRPRLLPGWEALEMSVRYHGALVSVRAERDRVVVATDRRLPLLFGDEAPLTLEPGATEFPPAREGSHRRQVRRR